MKGFLIALLYGAMLFLIIVLFDNVDVKRKPTNIYYDSSRAMDITLTCKSGYIFAITDKGGIVQVYETDDKPMLCTK